MSSVFNALLVAGLLTLASGEPPTLRVCSDPNNMPFSNHQQEGFENKIAELVAREMGRTVSYFWTPQRRAFIRNTLGAERCDVIMGVPSQLPTVATTRPYYRSSYVFVSRRDSRLDIRSFDDPRLRRVRIGVQLTGDDYDNPPGAQALAARHITDNVRGFTVYGDYATTEPQRDVVDAVANGVVDIAVVWGPLAGYFARRQPQTLAIVPVPAGDDRPMLPFRFAIAMGVRRDNPALRDALDRIIVRRQAEIRRILMNFGVPLV